MTHGRKPKILFMGTAAFAVPSLDILVRNAYTVAAVVTAPDKPAGRGLKARHSPVKEYAVSKGLSVLQPTNLKDETFLSRLRELAPDLGVVAAFRMLPEQVWSLPPLGTVNLHASLLPEYRGAAPISRAIMNGEKETGVTTFFLKHEIDTGDIIFREKLPIGEDEDAGSLHDRLKEVGAELVLRTVRTIEHGDCPRRPQDLSGPHRKAPKIFTDDCRIDWRRPAQELHNFVRGLSPHPGAWTIVNGKRMKILKSAVEPFAEKHQPGTVLANNGICIVTGNGTLRLLLIRPEGKETMTIEEFLKGNRFPKKLD